SAPADGGQQRTAVPESTAPTASGTNAVLSPQPPAGSTTPSENGSSSEPSPLAATPDPTVAGDQSPPAAVSSTTTQTGLQIQVSGCISPCVGTSQIQVAAQQNTTVQ